MARRNHKLFCLVAYFTVVVFEHQFWPAFSSSVKKVNKLAFPVTNIAVAV